jgi:hypothetical protein
MEASGCARSIARASESMASLYGSSWKGIDSDWDLIDAQVNWIIGAQTGIREGNLAAWCLDPVAYRRDRRKDQLLQENGYVVLRFLADDTAKDLDAVLDAILRVFARTEGLSIAGRHAGGDHG